MSAVFLLAAGGIALTAGDIIFKIWIERSGPYVSYLYAGGFILYLLGLFLLIESFTTENITVTSALLALWNISTLALVSHFYFKESLSRSRT